MNTTDSRYTKWVACWGNATSIIDQKECVYAKNLTLRYPIFTCFSGSALRFHFSNLTGTEPITLTEACVADAASDKELVPETLTAITFGGSRSVTIQPGEEIVSDEISFCVQAGKKISVNLYLADCTQMNAGVLITGPLSKGFYSYGRFLKEAVLPLDYTRNTNWFYFLNTIDVLTEENNHALICYGDSITAQSWPDYLTLRAWENGYRNVSIIRRAVSGTRILRQYDNITYAAYGLKGSTRFPIEMKAAGADSMIIQHGINDIIHPVGTEVNIFRPWSDLPKVSELIEGTRELYLKPAKEAGMKVYAGTLLPIFGWRTYEPFRNDMRCEFNEWLKHNDEFDGCIDFDQAVCDPEKPEAFGPGCDSGDHLHPSEAAYKRMAEAVPEELLK